MDDELTGLKRIKNWTKTHSCAGCGAVACPEEMYCPDCYIEVTEWVENEQAKEELANQRDERERK